MEQQKRESEDRLERQEQESQAGLQQQERESEIKLEQQARENRTRMEQLEAGQRAGLAALRGQMQGLISQIKQAAEAEVERGMAELERQVGPSLRGQGACR